MSQATRHDAWQAGDRYDAFMGRWSRQIAPRFLDWFGAAGDLDWLDLGCGTGALSGAILGHARPRSLIGIDPSESFVAEAAAKLADPAAEFQIGDAMALALENASRDAVVSGLVLNFVADREAALAEMQRVARPCGKVGFYVWDYPGRGLAFLNAFWRAATALDPSAADLTEERRFPFCTAKALTELAASAGLADVESAAIEAPTVFRDFEDYWHPFTLGAGPAPGYCASLDPEAQERLMQKLCDSLTAAEDGSITLPARAWAIKGIVLA